MAVTFSEYGKKIRHRLVDLDENRSWLISQVRGKTGLYFDNGYLWKIETGRLETPSIIEAINEILDIKEDT